MLEPCAWTPDLAIAVLCSFLIYTQAALQLLALEVITSELSAGYNEIVDPLLCILHLLSESAIKPFIRDAVYQIIAGKPANYKCCAG